MGVYSRRGSTVEVSRLMQGWIGREAANSASKQIDKGSFNYDLSHEGQKGVGTGNRLILLKKALRSITFQKVI